MQLEPQSRPYSGDVMACLREQTRDLHVAVEADVVAMGAFDSRDGYRRYLELLLGFYEPVESALAAALAGSDAVSDAAERWKTPLLAADLSSLGLGADEIHRLPRCTRLPSATSPTPHSPGAHAGSQRHPARRPFRPDRRESRALGCMYVLEGATLGGAVVLRQLTESNPSVAACAGRYLGAYGPERGRRWRAFGDAARAHVRRAGEPASAEMVAGARATFTALGAWLRASGHPR